MKTLFIVSGNGLKSEFWEAHFEQVGIERICMFSSVELCMKNLKINPVAIVLDDYFSSADRTAGDVYNLCETAGVPIFHLSPKHANGAKSINPDVIFRNFSTELVDDIINSLGDGQVA